MPPCASHKQVGIWGNGGDPAERLFQTPGGLEEMDEEECSAAPPPPPLQRLNNADNLFSPCPGSVWLIIG